MAMAGQMVKSLVTRYQICCQGNLPGTQFRGENSYFPIARGVVRGGRDYSYFPVSNRIGATLFSFGR